MTTMIVLGLVLIVLVVVFGIAVVVSNPDVVNLNLFNALVPVTMSGVFFTGAGAMLTLLLGALLIQQGVARSRRLRRQYQTLNAAGSGSAVSVPSPADQPTPTGTTQTPTTEPATAPPQTAATGTGRTPMTQPALTPPALTPPVTTPGATTPAKTTPLVTAPSAPVTTVGAALAAAAAPDDTEVRSEPTGPRSTLDLEDQPPSTSADRMALLEEADRLTQDDPAR